jgi:SAM-dependent methyltransferase
MAKLPKRSTAQQADRHQLYEMSVQDAQSEVDFIVDAYRQVRGRPARLLREDFCGTAAVCCDWVTRHKDNHAIGVDLDPDVLAWGKTHNLTKLKPAQAARISLLEADVLKVKTAAVDVPDVIVAMNFSYWCFHTRALLKAYFKRVHGALAKDGVLIMDAFGGYEAFSELKEKRKVKKGKQRFTYHWQQERFNPIDHALTCSIHFGFEDGSKLKRAFVYDWRLWTLPELRDLLDECGFDVTFYWQGFDEDGDADGDFKPSTTADADAGWICYILAAKR